MLPNSIMGFHPNPLRKRGKSMSNFLFFLLGLMVGGLSGITLMCFCIIAKESDNHIFKKNDKNTPEKH